MFSAEVHDASASTKVGHLPQNRTLILPVMHVCCSKIIYACFIMFNLSIPVWISICVSFFLVGFYSFVKEKNNHYQEVSSPVNKLPTILGLQEFADQLTDLACIGLNAQICGEIR